MAFTAQPGTSGSRLANIELGLNAVVIPTLIVLPGSAVTNNSGLCVLNAPAGLTHDDILIAVAVYDSSEGLTTVTPDQTWNVFMTWDFYHNNTTWFWRRATNSEPSTYSFALAITRAFTKAFSCGITAIRGCPVPSDPIDVIGVPHDSVTAAAITTIHDKDLIAYGVSSFSIGSMLPPPGFTTSFSEGSNFQDMGCALAYKVPFTPPGDTGNATGFWVGGASTFLFAIKGSPDSPKPRLFMNMLVTMPLRGTAQGQFSRITALPGNGIIASMKEVQVLSNRTYGIFALTGDNKVYQLFGGTQDGTITSVAQTQPLPTAKDINPELWDTLKVFTWLILEGDDLTNFKIQAIDDAGRFYPDASTFWTLAPNQHLIRLGGIKSRQISLRFQHDAATANVPQLSMIKLKYDIEGLTV